jgi:magnesium chelatase family protein
MTKSAGDMLYRELERGRLTARGLHRVRRVSRTLADLGGVSGEIDEEHVVRALAMRSRIGLSAVGQAA